MKKKNKQPTIDDPEVISIIFRIARNLYKTYRFGYYTADDFCQQAIIMVKKTQALEKFDPKRKLENYLARILRNQFHNFKRDNYVRQMPCKNCPLKAYLPPNGCSLYKERQECDLFRRWVEYSEKKINLQNPIDIYSIKSEGEGEPTTYYFDNCEDHIDTAEIHRRLLKGFSVQARKIYLMSINGTVISKKTKFLMQEEARTILDMQDE